MRSWYKSPVDNFLSQSISSIIGALTRGSARDGFSVEESQLIAWESEISILKDQLKSLQNADIFLEFNIPRTGRRIDALILIHSDKPHIVVVEFKVGKSVFNRQDIDQVTDYCLELKNFHLGSHKADIYPALITTSRSRGVEIIDNVACMGKDDLSGYMSTITYRLGNGADGWENSPYRPTPTIVEAARALYAGHSVADITRNESGDNINATCAKINDIIKDCKENNKKTIIFVTGVPGAGKTLVGLNIATEKRDKASEDHAVLLSGNGPLVNVLTEALARDERDTKGTRIGEARNKVKSFIQIVHHYRDEYIKDTSPPSEHVAIFDEAQRAWDGDTITSWMNRKNRRWTHGESESGFLISTLDRHDDWACVVCLVGGGQELKKGEAGIGEWLKSVPSGWNIAISPNILDSEYNTGDIPDTAEKYSELHLSTSMRSFRAENLSEFVKALLDLDEKAKDIYNDLSSDYPIWVTRDLKKAKEWIRKQAKGSERIGMLATSRAQRLIPFAIDSTRGINEVHYFLDGKDSNKSSYYLEDAASEFVCQGLELDYSFVCWDADVRYISGHWEYYNSKNSGEKGVVWQNNIANKQEAKNAYRVLLTRARQGMVIFIPNGNYPPDSTRRQEFYDGIFSYLRSLGIREITANEVDKGY